MTGQGRIRVLLAAGGTGGHLFPAEALGAVLQARGADMHLVTDERARHYGGMFDAAHVHVVPSETLRGKSPMAMARTAALLGIGLVKAAWLIRQLKPDAIVGFGGYPTLPPLFAASLLRVPVIVHDANAVMGRANRALAGRATAIATSFSGILDAQPALAAKAVLTGNPLRPAVLAVAHQAYDAPAPGAPLKLLVFGGSQGARVMADIVPPAVERLEPALWSRLNVVQQVRAEDMERVRAVYDRLKIRAELAPFFGDLPQRMADAHLVISRSGAGSVAELAAIGRPAILVPLPHALDQDQHANAGVLAAVGGALRIAQAEFTPDRLSAELSALAAEPHRLAHMAAQARAAGRLDAAERLADLVEKVARGA